jgi:hypothetical protein
VTSPHASCLYCLNHVHVNMHISHRTRSDSSAIRSYWNEIYNCVRPTTPAFSRPRDGREWIAPARVNRM